MIAKSIETTAETIVQAFENCFRTVTGVEQNSVGNLVTSVKKLFSVRARQATLLARDDVRIVEGVNESEALIILENAGVLESVVIGVAVQYHFTAEGTNATNRRITKPREGDFALKSLS